MEDLNDLDPLDQAKRLGYLRSPALGTDTDAALRRRWLSYCKLHDLPLMEVRDRMFYATVNLDTSTCARRVLTREGANRIRGLLYRFAEPLGGSTQRHVHGGSGEPRAGISIWSERIPREKAAFAAHSIVSIVRQEMVEWQGEGTFTDYVPADG